MLRTVPRHLLLVIVVIAYLGLGTIYGIATPIFEAPDEDRHFAYVQHLVKGEGLPVLDVERRHHQVDQEVAQPPLYYMVAALATLWIPVERSTGLSRNPHAQIGIPLHQAPNRNMYLHSADESLPYEGTPLAVHTARWLSIVLGAGVVVASYLVALKIRPDDRYLATVAAAVTGFNPQFLFVSASVSNDSLISLLGSVGLVMILFALGRYPGDRFLAALGVVIGLAVLSKPSGLALIPLVGLALMSLAWHDRSLRQLARGLSLVVTPVVALTGWWFLRNAQLYGDPLALICHYTVSGRSDGFGLPDLLSEAEGLWRSYWGVFGWFNVLGPPVMYAFYDALALLAGSGLLFGLVMHLRRGHRHLETSDKALGTQRALPLAFAVLWIGLVLIALLNWSLAVQGSQGRLLFPALAAASALMALGLWQLPLPKRLVGGAVALAMFGIALMVPFAVIGPAYAKPPLVTGEQLGEVPNPIHVNFDDKMELMGYRLSKTTVNPGGSLELTLYWRVLGRTQQDYSVYIHALGLENQLVAQEDTYPGGGAYRTSDLLPGQAFTETHRLVISDRAEGPGLGRIDVGLYDKTTMKSLPAFDPEMKPVGIVPAGTFRIRPLTIQHGEPTHRLTATFDYKIELFGYDLSTQQGPSGYSIHLTLYWKALGVPDRDFTVFVHAVGRRGIVAQYDSPPKKGGYPTSAWESGDVVVDSIHLPIPPTVADGQYQLLVGLYDLATGKRLTVGGGDYLTLATLSLGGVTH